MALLQDPLKVLDQIDRYLNNPEKDSFPGARILAAGNLCRQLAEQIAFILCVYSKMPRPKFLRPNGSLRILSDLLTQLGSVDPITGLTYWTLARRRGPRIARLAMKAKLNLWRNWFNEPSHYSAPGHRRRIGEKHLQTFISDLRSIIDEKDFGLIVAAYNEIASRGALTAELSSDADNSPASHQRHVLRIRDIAKSSTGALEISGAPFPIRVLPDDVEVRPQKAKGPVLVAGQTLPVHSGTMVNEAGSPIDLTNFATILKSLMPTERDERRLKRRLKKLGFTLQIRKTPASKQLVLPLSNQSGPRI